MNRLLRSLVALALVVPCYAQVTTTFNYPDDQAAFAAGWTYEALAPRCNSTVNVNRCNTNKDIDYWRRNRCQSGQDRDCLFPDQDQPCDTRIGHPGEWRIPENTSNMLAADNIVNLMRYPIGAAWTALTLNVPGVFIKHGVDKKGVSRPSPSDLFGQGGIAAYWDNDDYASITVGKDANGTFIQALSKEGGNYYDHLQRVPIALDGPDGINFTGLLRILRSGQTFTFQYSRNGGATWTVIGEPRTTTVTGIPGYAVVYVTNAITNHTPCFRVAGMTVE